MISDSSCEVTAFEHERLLVQISETRMSNGETLNMKYGVRTTRFKRHAAAPSHPAGPINGIALGMLTLTACCQTTLAYLGKV